MPDAAMLAPLWLSIRVAALAIYDAVQVGETTRGAWLAAGVSLLSIAALVAVQAIRPAAEVGQ